MDRRFSRGQTSHEPHARRQRGARGGRQHQGIPRLQPRACSAQRPAAQYNDRDAALDGSERGRYAGGEAAGDTGNDTRGTETIGTANDDARHADTFSVCGNDAPGTNTVGNTHARHTNAVRYTRTRHTNAVHYTRTRQTNAVRYTRTHTCHTGIFSDSGGQPSSVTFHNHARAPVVGPS
jgi:hypothetical protein